MLDVEDVRQSVKDVARAAKHDPEKAHIAEDDLHELVLVAIAGGQCSDPVACAREALETRKLDFPRWCA